MVLCVPLIAFAAGDQTSSAAVYEIAINNGRVIDPETGLDAQRNIGILNGKIATITGNEITAQRTIDARGKIVAPGLDISNVSLAATGEPLTRDRYAEAMASNPGQPVIVNLGHDKAMRTALTFPYVVIASDALVVVENGAVLKTVKAGAGIRHR